MKREEGQQHKTEIERMIKEFVATSPLNRLRDVGGRYFDEPLIGCAGVHDPLFREYKTIIGDFHYTPEELFEASYGRGSLLRGTVICWILPISDEVRKSNRQEEKLPSREWSHTRYFGEFFNEELRRYVAFFLINKGFRAIAPVLTPQWKRLETSCAGHASTWSERHAAFAAGLGTFSLTDALITPKGIAHRVGCVITDLLLEPTKRPYKGVYDYCLKYNSNTCGTCIKRCPAGAITERGHDKEACFQYMRQTVCGEVNEKYGVAISGCGLCQTKVPCEHTIPKQTSS